MIQKVDASLVKRSPRRSLSRAEKALKTLIEEEAARIAKVKAINPNKRLQPPSKRVP